MNKYLSTTKSTFALITFCFIITLFSCKENSSKLDKKLFIGSWREVRHLENPYDENRVIKMSIKEDGTCSMSLPYHEISLTGKWYLTSIDTVQMLTIRNDQEINSIEEYRSNWESSRQETYYRYYFFKVNKAEKGKLYITDISTNEAYLGCYEHLLKPVE